MFVKIALVGCFPNIFVPVFHPTILWIQFVMRGGVSEPREHDYQYPKDTKEAIDGSVAKHLSGNRLEHSIFPFVANALARA